MNIKIFNLFAIIAFAVLAFTGCQKENLVNEQTSENKGVAVDAEKSYPILKGTIPRKPGVVYIPNSDWSELIQHNTLKVKNLSGTVMQEWLIIDMKSDAWFHFNTQSGDATGSTYGMYYRWGYNFDNMSQNDWNQMVYDVNWTSLSGFHIPTETDINNLASVVGSTRGLRSFLQLGYDGAKNYGPDYTTDFAAMWVSQPGNPNIVRDCGVFLQWKRYENDRMYYFYTNIEDLRVNVRLVRNITASQW